MSTIKSVEKPIRNPLVSKAEGFDSLVELALDLRSAWDHATDEIWRQLDPALWDFTHNPWVVLQTVSKDKLDRVMADPDFQNEVAVRLKARRQVANAPAWFQQTHPKSPLTCVAYFCMEFMLSEALPIYSGGLGNVAGDQLKAASDLGIPVIGVGLLYQQGYFRQVFDRNGAQEALYPYNDPGQLPITPLRQPNGEWLRLEVALPDYSIWLRTWQVQVGRVKLYLLDSNDAANFPAHRGITSELYGGGPELRLKQEMVLGIGGWRLLTALGIKPEVCHLNEGHAAFAVLERAGEFMQESKQTFDVALAATRAGNVFTTHTAVTAGFDLFPPALIERYLAGYAKTKLGISLHELLALGRQNPNDKTEKFNMAFLAIRGCGSANGVSQLHGQVSRRLFAPLFPKWPADEVPIGHVTNGVHMPTWDSAAADEIWTTACSKARWLGTKKTLARDIRCVSDECLWDFRLDSRKALVDYARERLVKHYAAASAPPELIQEARHVFDVNALTIGFARRFATYKRPNLLLQDPARLLRILNNPQRPVQLMLAGKAHPADLPGQALIQQWIQFSRQPEARSRVIFLSDYDMHVAERLVQGVDVWINTPRRPWEACGTSGMKVLVNGGINLSVLDGWWAEAYTPEVGWALGDGQEHGDDPSRDAAEAEELYEILEREVVHDFYTRDEKGIPTAWVSRMRESMAQLTPRFSASRTVRDYTEQHYLLAAKAYHSRSADNGALATQLHAWQRDLEQQWPTLRLGDVTVTTREQLHVFEVHVYFGELDPNSVRVELYADGVNGEPPTRQEMQRDQQLVGAPNSYGYNTAVDTARPTTDYTVRVVPIHKGASVPLENTKILWHQ